MSYYMQGYTPINPGTPASYWSPIPGWNANPFAAGPQRVAVSGCGCQGMGAETPPDYNKTSYGVVYLAAAGALLVGALAGYAAAKRMEQRRYRRNAARRYRRNSGERFARLERQLKRKGADDPAALAAWIGRRKYGKKKFQQMAARGRRSKR